MTSDQKAADPARRVLGFEGDAAGTFEQYGKHGSCLDTSEGGTDTVVDTSSERHMTTGDAPLKVDLVRSSELVGVAISGAPEQ